MTIGKNSRKSSIRSSIRAPKFLDKSNGFYGRLDEPETAGKEVEERWNGMDDGSKEGGVVSSQTPSVVQVSGADEREEVGGFDFDEGMMEDDGETLLQKKPSRRSSRWRRSSRRKKKEVKSEEDAAQDDRPTLDSEIPADPSVLEDTRVIIQVEMERLKMEEEKQKEGRGTEPALVHFTIKEDEDDQVLIRDRKRGREEEEDEERRMRKEQEEEMKVEKRNTLKNYRKAFDQALRRGWEVFITNLYSVTLTPVTPSSPSSSSPAQKKKHQHNSVLTEFQ